MPGQYHVLSLNCAHIKKVTKAYASILVMGSFTYCSKCKTERAVVYKLIEVR